jgi:hypothetical protein
LISANGWLVAAVFFVTLASLAALSRVLIARLPRLIRKERNLRKKLARETAGV